MLEIVFQQCKSNDLSVEHLLLKVSSVLINDTQEVIWRMRFDKSLKVHTQGLLLNKRIFRGNILHEIFSSQK